MPPKPYSVDRSAVATAVGKLLEHSQGYGHVVIVAMGGRSLMEWLRRGQFAGLHQL
jgi:hypothetical protein